MSITRPDSFVNCVIGWVGVALMQELEAFKCNDGVQEANVDTISLLMQIAELEAEKKPLKEQKVDCKKCANRGVVNGLSQESFCNSCIFYGSSWKTNNYKL